MDREQVEQELVMIQTHLQNIIDRNMKEDYQKKQYYHLILEIRGTIDNAIIALQKDKKYGGLR